MNRAESKLLDEVGRLTGKLNVLKDEIKKKTRHKEQLTQGVVDEQRKVQAFETRIKELKREETKLKASIGEMRSAQSNEIGEMEKKRIRLEGLLHEADEKIKASQDLTREIESKKGALKVWQDRLKKEREELAQRKAALDKKASDSEAELNNQKAALNAAAKELNTQKIVLQTKESNLVIEKDALRTAVRRLDGVKETLAKREALLSRKEKTLDEKAKKLARREADVKLREEELSESERVHSSEKDALEAEKNQVEIDRLRIEKLANDKKVKAELDKLRKETAQK